MPEYTLYGPEWQKEAMRNKKADLVQMLAAAGQERDGLRDTGAESAQLLEAIQGFFAAPTPASSANIMNRAQRMKTALDRAEFQST